MTQMEQYIDGLVGRGQSTFTLDEAVQSLGKSRAAVILSIEHLRKQQKLVSPARGFYVIVLPEYRRYGCLPAEYFLPYLMQYWQLPYYVGLASAAAYHGATHQQPQVMQVMLGQHKRPIHCGQVSINFYKNVSVAKTVTQKISTERSILTVSSPEATAVDLINYMQQVGGLSRVVTILDELQEAMQAAALKELMVKAEIKRYCQQRLGYILEKIGATDLADIIYHSLISKGLQRYVLLDPSKKVLMESDCAKNRRWKIIENSDFESDL